MKLKCPKCGENLHRRNNEAVCNNNHHYDYAKQGYLNLYQTHKPFHGDNTEMVKARTVFLKTGIYGFLKNYLVDLSKQLQPDALADLGCGEGYYTSGLVAKDKYGFDLSKDALKHAAKFDKSTQYIVSSIFRLPLADESVNTVLTCFAPAAIEEIQRILQPNGTFIYVTPGPKHLFEMKEVLYDHPYENILDAIPTDLQLVCDELIEQKTQIFQNALQQLFQMTPYYYKTSAKSKQRLQQVTELELTCQFRIRIFKKHQL